MEATEVRHPRPSEGFHHAAVHHPFVPSPLLHLPGPRGRAKPSVVHQAQRKVGAAAAALRLRCLPRRPSGGARAAAKTSQEGELRAKAYKVFH